MLIYSETFQTKFIDSNERNVLSHMWWEGFQRESC